MLTPLSDLIHQVPRLLELMTSECLAALIATSTTHRSQVHNYVTSITISDSTHASDLISCSWPRLVKWTLADLDSHSIQTIRVTCDMTVPAASLLAKASMLSKWQLQLDASQLSAAVAAEIAKGDWPFLVGLYFWHAKLTRAAVEELVAANWPALTLLSSVAMSMHMDVLSLLSQARWPQLALLNLFNTMLASTQEGEELEAQLSPIMSDVLSRMVSNADPDRTSSSSSAISATFDWSSIIMMSLAYQQIDTQMVTKLLHTGVNQIQELGLACILLDAAAILELTQAECPNLRWLGLYHTGLGSAAMLYLAQGKWPLLDKLVLEGNILEDGAADELFKGKWPLLKKLKLTVRSLRGKTITKWLGLSSVSLQEALRQPEQDLQIRELEVKFSASNAADMQPPLHPIRHVYPLPCHRDPVPAKDHEPFRLHFWAFLGKCQSVLRCTKTQHLLFMLLNAAV